MLKMTLGIVVLLGVFTATGYAASMADMPDASGMLDLLKPVYEAFMSGQKLYAGMLALVLAVALLKRYAPAQWGISAFVHGDAGGTLLTLLGSFGGAMVTALAAGATPDWAMAKVALYIAFGAAGGYAIVKKLIIEPIIKPLIPKMPLWLQRLMPLLLWVFDKPTPIASAIVAGQEAVDANPPAGVDGITGTPTKVE